MILLTLMGMNYPSEAEGIMIVDYFRLSIRSINIKIYNINKDISNKTIRARKLHDFRCEVCILFQYFGHPGEAIFLWQTFVVEPFQSIDLVFFS